MNADSIIDVSLDLHFPGAAALPFQLGQSDRQRDQCLGDAAGCHPGRRPRSCLRQ